MNEKTASRSQGFGLRRAFWAASMASLAMGLTLACNEGADDDTASDEQTETIGQVSNALLDASACNNCTMQRVCKEEFVPCNPPVEINGRKITCLEEVCRDERVCTPCSEEVDSDDIDGIDLGILDGIGGLSPIDPSPLF
jgi:hypothetical protein